MLAHYSKSQTFVQKFNLTSFSSFSPKIFDNFSREIKVVNSQKVQNYNIFTRKVEFLDKK